MNRDSNEMLLKDDESSLSHLEFLEPDIDSDFFKIDYEVEGALYIGKEVIDVEDFSISIYLGVVQDINQKVVARLKFYKIDNEYISSNNISVTDVLDAYSETARFIQFFDEYDDINIGDIDLFELQNLLILSRLEVVAKYRGLGLGKTILDDVKKRFFCSETDIMFLQAFPLQFENSKPHNDATWSKRMSLDIFPTIEKSAKTNLGKYYESLGFEQIKGEYYYLKES
ncbi:hypothetical protein [Pseudoalteromonas sp. GutCa3]|uniref:hypothetical protein n=1 Tax=Pseudoalteromonas sp. GutCa3 TaxID=888433 RepID=UPI000C343862|nr:hypothetical protein [Pseudoalteromonas sp. GutCa3]PKG68642.1 hypothetical protein CXF64_20175 [Pseudoalteromonas sp. GutCa3]